MKRVYQFITFLSVILIITSCMSDKILFTHSMRQRIESKELPMEKVQFYNSDQIVLRREVPKDDARLAKGEIKFEHGKYIEEIVIQKETPGTVEALNAIYLDVSFEQGLNRTIRFKRDVYEDFYQIFLVADENNYGTLLYDSLMYNVKKGGGEAKLMVKKDESYINEFNQRVVPGKKVNN